MPHVHPSRDGFAIELYFGLLLLVRLCQELFIDDFALELHIGIGLLQLVFDFEVEHLIRQHFLDVQGVVAQVGLFFVCFQQFEHQTHLRREGNPHPLVAKIGSPVPDHWLQLDSEVTVVSVVDLASDFGLLGWLLHQERLYGHIDEVLLVSDPIHCIF